MQFISISLSSVYSFWRIAGVDRGVDPVIESWRGRGKGREFATGSSLHQSFQFGMEKILFIGMGLETENKFFLMKFNLITFSLSGGDQNNSLVRGKLVSVCLLFKYCTS